MSIRTLILNCLFTISISVSAFIPVGSAQDKTTNTTISQGPYLEVIRTIDKLLQVLDTPIQKQQLGELWTQMNAAFESGQQPTKEEHRLISDYLAIAAIDSHYQDQWSYVRLLIEDYNHHTAQFRKLDRQPLTNPSPNYQICSLSDPDNSCTFSFGNPSSRENPKGSCRGYSESILFINNNFSFNSEKKYRGQCPLPRTVCEDIFGSFQKLVFPTRGNLDEYFSWNSQTCTYEIPCFNNLRELSSQCFTPEKKGEESAYPQVIFQNLVSSFQTLETSYYLAEEELTKKGFKLDKASLLDVPGVLISTVNQMPWGDFKKTVSEHGLPAVIGVGMNNSDKANHAILVTDYNKERDEIVGFDSNYPQQIVRLHGQSDWSEDIREVFKNDRGTLDSKLIGVYQLVDSQERRQDRLLYFSPFYATFQNKECHNQSAKPSLSK